MQSLVIEEPGRFHFEDRPEPALPPGFALLRVRSVGLCGTDLSTYQGRNPLVTYPRVPGHEIAATIVELNGEAATDLRVRPERRRFPLHQLRPVRVLPARPPQRVSVQSDFRRAARWRAHRPHRRSVLPSHRCRRPVPLRHLSIVEPLTVGFHAVSRGRVTASDTVAVIGCGGVGLGAVSGAAFRGATVIGIDVDDAKLAAGPPGRRHSHHPLRAREPARKSGRADLRIRPRM